MTALTDTVAAAPAATAGAPSAKRSAPPITGALKAAVVAVGVAVAMLGTLGFANSFERVDLHAQHTFRGLAWSVPIGIDLAILIVSALDIILAHQHMRIPWLRFIPWALTAVTIKLNTDNLPGQAPLTSFDKLAHGVLPGLWALSVEVGAHVVRMRADLNSATAMDRVRLSRWLLAPTATAGLWRRMVLWEETSYTAALARERARVLARTDLADAYGRLWRWKAPRRARVLYRLGELTPTPTTDDTSTTGPDRTSTSGPDPRTGSTSTRRPGSTPTRRDGSTPTGRTGSTPTPTTPREFAELLEAAREVPRWRGRPSAQRIRAALHIKQATATKLAAALAAEDSETPTPTPIPAGLHLIDPDRTGALDDDREDITDDTAEEVA